MVIKKNRIDFYNMLVASSEISFDDFWGEVSNQAEYLEKRSFLILDFFSAFKKIYKFFIQLDDKDEIIKLYCDFKDKKTMKITLKSNNINSQLINDIEDFFKPRQKDNYVNFNVETSSEKNTTLKLFFLKE